MSASYSKHHVPLLFLSHPWSVGTAPIHWSKSNHHFSTFVLPRSCRLWQKERLRLLRSPTWVEEATYNVTRACTQGLRDRVCGFDGLERSPPRTMRGASEWPSMEIMVHVGFLTERYRYVDKRRSPDLASISMADKSFSFHVADKTIYSVSRLVEPIDRTQTWRHLSAWM